MSRPSSHGNCGGCGGSGGCQSQAAEEVAGATTTTSLEGPPLCRKCGEEEVFHDRQCRSCFRTSVFGKFKLAVTSNAMISPLDNVLVAFSGGPASRVALHFVHEMQLKAQKSWDASRDQSLPVFGVGVAVIDESSVLDVPSHEMTNTLDQIRQVVSSLAPPTKELYMAPIDSIWSPHSTKGKTRLHKLLNTVTDATGKEDLLQYMRMLCLQKIALDNGFSKLLLGTCTTRIACHILSATVKGQGYSLPADVQYVDARWEIPIVYPLRDCLAQELTMICHLDGLQTLQVRDQTCSGINELISSFLARLQEENPSRARTIVRTAEKLSPFSFNKLDNICSDMLPSRIRRKFQISEVNGSNTPDVLCTICGSPIGGLDPPIQRGASVMSQDLFASNCCHSCINQILPKEASKFEEFYSLLPPQMLRGAQDVTESDHARLREQIKDFLLPEDDDGT